MAFDKIFAAAILNRNVVLGMVFDQSNEAELNYILPPIQKIDKTIVKKLTITNMNFNGVNDGAGVMVVLDDGTTPKADIALHEGNDFAFINGSNTDRQTTVAQVFNFTPSTEDRTVNVELMFASVFGDASGSGDRPSAIDVTIGGTTTEFNNLLDSVDGDEWDSVTLSDLSVPATVGTITVQAFSENRLNLENPPGTPLLEASFHWLAAGLAIVPPPPPPPVVGEGRMTGGGKIKDNGIWVITSSVRGI